MQLPISQDGLTIGPFTANTIDGVFYIKPTGNTASLTLYFGILPGGVKMIKHDKVISIEAAANYVNILYDKGGQLVKFSLRNTLKGIEELCNNYDIVRCHRSYFVNPKYAGPWFDENLELAAQIGRHNFYADKD